MTASLQGNFDTGKYNNVIESTQQYDPEIPITPELYEQYILRIKSFLNLGNTTDALEDIVVLDTCSKLLESQRIKLQLLRIAILIRRVGDLETAEEELKEVESALELYEDKKSLNYLQLKCDFLKQKGVLMDMQSNYEQAEEMLEKALDIARDMEDKNTEVSILLDYGHIYFSRGILTKSLEICNETLKIVGEERNQLYYVVLNALLANYIELDSEQMIDESEIGNILSVIEHEISREDVNQDIYFENYLSFMWNYASYYLKKSNFEKAEEIYYSVMRRSSNVLKCQLEDVFEKIAELMKLKGVGTPFAIDVAILTSFLIRLTQVVLIQKSREDAEEYINKCNLLLEEDILVNLEASSHTPLIDIYYELGEFETVKRILNMIKSKIPNNPSFELLWYYHAIRTGEVLGEDMASLENLLSNMDQVYFDNIEHFTEHAGNYGMLRQIAKAIIGTRDLQKPRNLFSSLFDLRAIGKDNETLYLGDVMVHNVLIDTAKLLLLEIIRSPNKEALEDFAIILEKIEASFTENNLLLNYEIQCLNALKFIVIERRLNQAFIMLEDIIEDAESNAEKNPNFEETKGYKRLFQLKSEIEPLVLSYEELKMLHSKSDLHKSEEFKLLQEKIDRVMDIWISNDIRKQISSDSVEHGTKYKDIGEIFHPVAVLAVALPSGLSVHTHKFKEALHESKALRDQQTAGLFTTLDIFFQRIFNSDIDNSARHGPIRSIKYNKYNIVSLKKESIKYWLIFRGSIALGHQKLSEFVNILWKDHRTIWTNMEKQSYIRGEDEKIIEELAEDIIGSN